MKLTYDYGYKCPKCGKNIQQPFYGSGSGLTDKEFDKMMDDMRYLHCDNCNTTFEFVCELKEVKDGDNVE